MVKYHTITSKIALDVAPTKLLISSMILSIIPPFKMQKTWIELVVNISGYSGFIILKF